MKKGFMISVLLFFLCGCADREILTEIPESIAISVEEVEVPTETIVEEPEFTFLDEQVTAYAYHYLTEAEQRWYDDIAACLASMQSDRRLDEFGIEQGLDENDIDKVFQCVMIDHPELFYVEGYTYTRYERGETLIAIDFSGTYSMDEETAMVRYSQIQAAADVLLVGAHGLFNEYDKVKYVYEALIRNTEYLLDAPDNQNIYSVFVNKKSVCQGYAKAAQFLLGRLGVECSLVQGLVDSGENHAWNLVKVNGAYYYVDVTWGDASYQSDASDWDNGYVPEINYDYLCVTTEQLQRTHTIQNYVPLPECTAEADNYYVRENTLFFEYDPEKMSLLFQKLGTEGYPDITVKCSDTDTYSSIYEALIEQQDIFDYLPEEKDTISYTLNEKQLSMTFWMTNE